MNTRKIYLVSPREPSGATWLINCFLELGIITYRISKQSMWYEESDKFFLNSRENMLKKWLPALSNHENFEFRSDIEIEWTHEWPTKKFDGHQIIYFIRDPRDSLYSRYKRENPDLSFREFIEFLDPYTLLNKIDNWYLFNKFWLSREELKVFRFEDYKKDAHGLLENILRYINLDFSTNLIDSAIDASSFEKAVEAEKRYREKNPEDNEIINRGGKVGSWKELDYEREVISVIENRAADLLTHFDYIPEMIKDGTVTMNYMHNLRLLSFFKTIKLESGLIDHRHTDIYNSINQDVISFAYSLDRELIIKSNLEDYEVKILINSLSEYIHNLQAETDRRFIALYSQDGSTGGYFLNLFKLTKNHIYLTKVPLIYLFQVILNRFKFYMGITPIGKLYLRLKNYKLKYDFFTE